jgi:hypothetical protein
MYIQYNSIFIHTKRTPNKESSPLGLKRRVSMLSTQVSVPYKTTREPDSIVAGLVYVHAHAHVPDLVSKASRPGPGFCCECSLYDAFPSSLVMLSSEGACGAVLRYCKWRRSVVSSWHDAVRVLLLIE